MSVLHHDSHHPPIHKSHDSHHPTPRRTASRSSSSSWVSFLSSSSSWWGLVLLAVGCVVSCPTAAGGTVEGTLWGMGRRTVTRRSGLIRTPRRPSSPTLATVVGSFRGGAQSTTITTTSTTGTPLTKKSSNKKKKKTKKKTPATTTPLPDEVEDDNTTTTTTSSSSPTLSTTTEISKAMKEKDAAQALGDAIRDRADILRSEDPFLQAIDGSIGSLGQALGTSDKILRRESGGVEAAQSSVIAHYFLKSHGGAHLLQSVCSLFSTLAGLGALALSCSSSSTPSSSTVGLTYTLVQRAFLFAMLKHVSGLIAASSLAAQAIPRIGLSQARQWMERIVTDPVSQYVFFNALMMVWLPSKQRVVNGACWWWKKNNVFLPLIIMMGPVLLREVIGNLWVLSDVLVLWSVASPGGSSPAIETLLKISNSIVNAMMSLLVTPGIWRGAEPAQRQAILSKLVSKVSLVLEAIIAILMVTDAALGIIGSAFFTGTQRPSFRDNVLRWVCVRLFVHFLWIRKASLQQVAMELRGGATHLPFYLLDVLYEPGKAMGLVRPSSPPSASSSNFHQWSWYDRLAFALGLMTDSTNGDCGKAIAKRHCGNQSRILNGLYLQHNDIGDEGIKAVSKALLTNSSTPQVLWKLLSTHNIGVDGAKDVAKVWNRAWEISSNVQTLHLGGNKVGVVGAKAIAKALKFNPSVQVLGVDIVNQSHT